MTEGERAEIAAKAKALGDDSWELLNFGNLRKNASAGAMAEALERDAQWIRLHTEAVVGLIENLASQIRMNHEW